MNRKVLIKGEIGYLDAEEGVIILKCFDLETGEMEVLHIMVPPNIEFRGLTSLFDLQVGDEIAVDVYENEVSRLLKAKVVERV